MQGMAGPIAIDRPASVKGGKHDALWIPGERRIVIAATLKREMAWHRLLHELVHAAETDSGYFLPEPDDASPQDAIASGMLHVVRYLLK